MPDALLAATLPIYPGLGPVLRDTEMCLRWLGFVALFFAQWPQNHDRKICEVLS